MSVEITILTTQDEFEQMHTAADSKRANVTVPREGLLHLLMDHSSMLGAIESSTRYRVLGHTPRRDRPRLKG